MSVDYSWSAWATEVKVSHTVFSWQLHHRKRAYQNLCSGLVVCLHCCILTKPDVSPAGKGEMLQGPDPVWQSRTSMVHLELGGHKLIITTITSNKWHTVIFRACRETKWLFLKTDKGKESNLFFCLSYTDYTSGKQIVRNRFLFIKDIFSQVVKKEWLIITIFATPNVFRPALYDRNIMWVIYII